MDDIIDAFLPPPIKFTQVRKGERGRKEGG